MAALYDLPAPAKLNLFLHVTGRRPDGYHDLQTVFRFIDLCDHLSFDLRRDGKVERDADCFPGLASDDDLVVKAARALQSVTGTSHGVQIRYTKRIPHGAGLGGGSSNAATTLIALNRLWNTGLDRTALMRLARPPGADVPVFIFGRSAFAEGVGDVLEEISLADKSYLVLQPQGSVATAAVFSDDRLTRNTEPVRISVFAHWHMANAQQETGLDEVEQQGAEQLYGAQLFGRNDLEPVVLAGYENVRRMAHALKDQGFRARMTGSGSCFFIEYNALEEAYRAQRVISSKMESLEGERAHATTRVHGQPPGGKPQGLAAVVKHMWACPGLSEHPLRHW